MNKETLFNQLFRPTRQAKMTADRDMEAVIKTHSGTLKITLYKGDTVQTEFDGSLTLNGRYRFQIVEYNPPTSDSDKGN